MQRHSPPLQRFPECFMQCPQVHPTLMWVTFPWKLCHPGLFFAVLLRRAIKRAATDTISAVIIFSSLILYCLLSFLYVTVSLYRRVD